MRTALLLTISLLATAGPALATPLDPAKTPRDAKWLVHLDHDLLSDMKLVEALADRQPKRGAQAARWVFDNFGIHPQQDLHAITLFGSEYKDGHWTAIVSADFDLEKLKEIRDSSFHGETTEWSGHTFYTFAVKMGELGPKSSGDADSHHAKQVTAVMVDRETVIYAASLDQAKSAVKLFNGDSPSLDGADSVLLTDLPEGAAVYGAATDLGSISSKEGVFPILQQHKRIEYAFGEHDGLLYEETVLVGRDEQVATQMAEGLEGFISLARVWSATSENLSRLYDDVKVERDGERVKAEWRGDGQNVVEAVDDIVLRAKQGREANKDRD